MTIRIGLLGASKISRGAIIEPARRIDGVAVTRVAARDPERARSFATEHGITEIEDSYAALVESDAVDLVYNGLPPSGHAEWSIRALAAGKHVLCEKPFALDATEVERMLEAEAASDGVLIEAFHHRYHPLWHRIVDLIESDAIGTIRRLLARFNYPIPYKEGELRYDRALGGGAIMDLGCYPVHWARTVCNSEPEVVRAHAVLHETGVDLSTTATLEFPGGAEAEIECSMASDLPETLNAVLEIDGTTGRMIVENPLAPHAGHSMTIESSDATRTEEVPGESTYYCQLEWTRDVLRGEKAPLTGGTDGLGNMRVIDAIRST